MEAEEVVAGLEVVEEDAEEVVEEDSTEEIVVVVTEGLDQAMLDLETGRVRSQTAATQTSPGEMTATSASDPRVSVVLEEVEMMEDMVEVVEEEALIEEVEETDEEASVEAEMTDMVEVEDLVDEMTEEVVEEIEEEEEDLVDEMIDMVVEVIDVEEVALVETDVVVEEEDSEVTDEEVEASEEVVVVEETEEEVVVPCEEGEAGVGEVTDTDHINQSQQSISNGQFVETDPMNSEPNLSIKLS